MIIIIPENYLYVLGNLFEVVEAMNEKINYMQWSTITLSLLGGMENQPLHTKFSARGCHKSHC